MSRNGLTVKCRAVTRCRPVTQREILDGCAFGYAFEGRFIRIVPVGLTPLGLFLLFRHDGNGVVDVSPSPQGPRVPASPRFHGYAVQPTALPELSVLLSPGFT
jgi:hypothetical protein